MRGSTRIEPVVEVVVSSLRRDLSDKPPIYAQAGAPTYWAIDLDADAPCLTPRHRTVGTRQSTSSPKLVSAGAKLGVLIPLPELFAAAARQSHAPRPATAAASAEPQRRSITHSRGDASCGRTWRWRRLNDPGRPSGGVLRPRILARRVSNPTSYTTSPNGIHRAGGFVVGACSAARNGCADCAPSAAGG